jgi:hypothetical protein
MRYEIDATGCNLRQLTERLLQVVSTLESLGVDVSAVSITLARATVDINPSIPEEKLNGASIEEYLGFTLTAAITQP